MTIYFLDKKDNKTIIGTAKDVNEANKLMMDYINNTLKFKSYYTRVLFDSETKVTIDYGSHTEFFIYELDEEEAKNKNFYEIYKIKQ